MSKIVYVVYDGDEWLSYMSLAVCGIFTSKRMAINAILKREKDDQAKTKEDRAQMRRQLEEGLQTQGYQHNYNVVAWETNLISV